jgi:N-acetylglucosaminyldiphosphoundecaprenol N-acetyl-beta-D-mannosaminyltransferase
MDAASNRRPFAVTALAVHGLVAACLDPTLHFRLSHFSLVTPDGQPVRWALRLLHGVALPDRVYGPELALQVCQAAAERDLPIYLYGSTDEVLSRLVVTLQSRFPTLRIAGYEPSKFRRTTSEEKAAIIQRIQRSEARITLVGLGCPRQEVFAYEYHRNLAMPVLAVGAAFDYHSGLLREPPVWMQGVGLQWLYRLLQEPRRLLWRYLFYNSVFLLLLLLQLIRCWHPKVSDGTPPEVEVLYG